MNSKAMNMLLAQTENSHKHSRRTTIRESVGIIKHNDATADDEQMQYP